MLGMFGAPPSTLEEAGNLYPRLRPHLAQTTVRRRPATNDGRQLEFYPPWERDNPLPGRLTVDVFNPALQGRDLSESVGLDMLHYLGSRAPDGNAVDPKFHALKDQMARSILDAGRPMDKQAYLQDRARGFAGPSYDDYLENNRADAYIRGFVSPRMNPEWQQEGTYTPRMRKIGEGINRILQVP